MVRATALRRSPFIKPRNNAMPYTMSQACVPPLEIGLNALSDNLDKATAFAAAKKIEPTVLTQWRLAPDMFPLAPPAQGARGLATHSAAPPPAAARRRSTEPGRPAH